MHLFYSLLCVFLLVAGSRADLIDQIIAAFEAAVDCPSCLALLSPLQAFAGLGDDTFVAGFIEVCDALHVSPYGFCVF